MYAKIELSDFGKILDDIRHERGDRLIDVARQCDTHENTIMDLRRYPMRIKLGENLLSALAAYTRMTTADILDAMYDSPGTPRNVTYPLITHIGIKYSATVRLDMAGCQRCPHLDACRRDVIERDGFAHCEGLIGADMLEPDAAAIVAANLQEDRYDRNRTLARSQ